MMLAKIGKANKCIFRERLYPHKYEGHKSYDFHLCNSQEPEMKKLRFWL